MNKMSSKECEEMEKLFCGSWELDREESIEAFLTASEMLESSKKVIELEKLVTISRNGTSFVERYLIGGAEIEFTTKLNEVIEWKDKEVDPAFHIKTLSTYENWIWTQETTPQQANGGRRQVYQNYIEGNERVMTMCIPGETDKPSVTAKRIFKKC